MNYKKEIAAYVAANVEDYEVRLQLALKKMGIWRCPLSMGDRELYDEIVDSACEWLDDNDISIENDMDWDEFIEGEEGIIWEC